MGKDTEEVGKKRKWGADEDIGTQGGFFHPRYLTGKRLLDHEVGPCFFLAITSLTSCPVGRRLVPPSDPGAILHPLPVPPQPHSCVGFKASFYRWYAEDIRH